MRFPAKNLLAMLGMVSILVVPLSLSIASEESGGAPKSSWATSLGLCDVVTTGSVGGQSSFSYEHKGSVDLETITVLRTTESSLCGSHAAVGVLQINREVVDHTLLSHDKSVQADTRPDDEVIAVVQLVDLSNGLNCFHFGEVTFNLEQCHLE